MADTYVILEADSAAELADRVNKAIEQGWLPNGGIVTVSILDEYRWFQPMIEQTAAMQVLGTAVDSYKGKPVSPVEKTNKSIIYVIGCPCCDNQSRSNTSYLQAHDIYILHLQLDHGIKTAIAKNITPAFSYSGTQEGFSDYAKPIFPAEGSPDYYKDIPAEDFNVAKAPIEIDDDYRTCVHGEWLCSIGPCVKCTDKTGENYLRIIVNIPPLTPCKQCGVTYGTHNDAELGHGFLRGQTAQKHTEQCGFIAIDDTIMFCDYDKGHKGGHSLRKTKIQGWT